jgi:hypothetical protein
LKRGPGASLLDRPAVIAVLVLLSLGVFLWPQLPFVQLALQLTVPDSDDAMRLLSVRDLIAGQSWFDMTQYRYLPPGGASLHWSRLIDAPMAAAIWSLNPLLGAKLAEGVVAAAWPPLLFLAYLAVIGFTMRRAFGLAAMGFAVLVACQMMIFADIFGAGRIDHHNMVAILIAASAAGFVLADRSRQAAILSGTTSALVLAVSLEALPFVAVIGALYALDWVIGNKTARRSLTRFGAALTLASILAFAVQTAPSRWLVPECDALSIPWLWLTCGGGSIALALAAASPRLRSWSHRLIAAAAGGGLLVLAFVLAFPACLDGPYQVVPEAFRSGWLGNIPEAFSFRRILEANANATLRCFGPLLTAAIIATVAALRTEGTARRMMVLLACLIWTGVLLCQIQIRAIYVASAFIPFVAGWTLERFVRAFQPPKARPREAVVLFCASALLFGAPWALGLNTAQAIGVSAKYQPVGGERSPACLLDRYVRALDQLPKGVVLAPIDLGAHLLIHTRHSIIAAGYHRAVEGIIAGMEAFSGSEDDLKRHVRRHRADYVVICPNWVVSVPNRPAPFARALDEGKRVSWLEPVRIEAGPLKVWRVRR